MTAVSCIGLGLMGSALARAFLAVGHGVTVWNRSAGKAGALVAMGATEAGTLGEAVAASPVVLICIDSYASTQALLQEQTVVPLLGGRTLVQLTTGTPQEAVALSDWAMVQGARYLDGAILCGPTEIGSKSGEVLFSGDQQLWQDIGQLLSCLAGKVRLVGNAAGAAAALDLAWLTMSYVQFIGVAHAANICRAEGIKLDEFISLFPPDPLRADIDTETCRLAGLIRDGDYGRPTATLAVWGEALARIQTQARDAGISSAIPDFIGGYFRRAVAAGLGQEEAIAIYRVLLSGEDPA